MENNNDDSKNNSVTSKSKETSATLITNSTKEHKSWAETWADKKIIKTIKEVKEIDDGSSIMAIKPTENWADRWTNNNVRLKPSSKAHSNAKMSNTEDAAKSQQR